MSWEWINVVTTGKSEVNYDKVRPKEKLQFDIVGQIDMYVDVMATHKHGTRAYMMTNAICHHHQVPFWQKWLIMHHHILWPPTAWITLCVNTFLYDDETVQNLLSLSSSICLSINLSSCHSMLQIFPSHNLSPPPQKKTNKTMTKYLWHLLYFVFLY